LCGAWRCCGFPLLQIFIALFIEKKEWLIMELLEDFSFFGTKVKYLNENTG
jgi:hypothetical protein